MKIVNPVSTRWTDAIINQLGLGNGGHFRFGFGRTAKQFPRGGMRHGNTRKRMRNGKAVSGNWHKKEVA